MTQSTCTANPIRKTAIASALAMLTAPVMAAELQLEEVIVTAQKRAESVQDVAATVNVVSGQDIERFQTFDFNALQQQTAGLTLSQPNARNNTISMRGISVDPEAGVSSAVDVYWNDAIIRSDIAFNQMYDLERVEILRGPQGTLQGRTSPGGAINMITKRPSLEEAEGYVQGSLSDNDGYNGQLAYGGALIPNQLAVRVAGVYDTSNGNDVDNITTGLDDQEVKAYSGRVTALWQPTDTLETQLTYQYLNRTADDPKGMSGTDTIGDRPTLKPDDRIALGNSNDFGDIHFNLLNLNANWEVMNHQLTGIIGYQESTKTAQTENDRAYSLAYFRPATEAPTFQDTQTKVDTISYELRASSLDNDFWNYMVGIYYQDQNTKTKYNANSVRLDVLGLGFQVNGVLPVNSNNFAIFTFNTLDLTDTLQLELGLRWTDYESYRRADTYFGGLTFVPGPLASIIDRMPPTSPSRRYPMTRIPPPRTRLPARWHCAGM